MNACLFQDGQGGIDEVDILGNPDCICGVDDTAWDIDPGDQLRINEGMFSIFDGDFTMSFYYSPRSATDQLVMLYGDSCDAVQSLAVFYDADLHRIEVEIRADAVFFIQEFLPLDEAKCWHYITVTRTGNNFFFYVDGVLRNSVFGLVVPFASDDTLKIGGISCGPWGEMDGGIDQIEFYDQSLITSQVRAKFIETDLLEIDQAVVQPNQPFQTGIANSCATTFSWSPSMGVSDPNIANPQISNTDNAEYIVEMFQDGCRAVDTFNLLVIDSSAFRCEDIKLPTAFTPNGDGLNEDFGILNPFLVQELESFRIVDRWGEIIFETNDLFARWDATFKGQPVNPGVFHYEVVYRCNEETFRDVGAIKVIR